MYEIEMGDIVYWPAQRNLKALVVCIDKTPDIWMAWIRRRDDLGDYHYHSVKLIDLELY